MVGPLVRPDNKKTSNDGGFLRPGDKRDIFVQRFELEKVDYFKIKPLYTALHDELADDGWVDPVSDDDKFESLYWERHLTNGMKEHHFWWRIVKYPQGKTGFIRYAAKIDFQSLAVKGAEIAYKGKKKKVESADLVIRLWFWVQWDFEDKFKNSFFKTFEQQFKRQIFKDELEQHWNHLYAISEKMRRFIKGYLDMEEAGEQPSQFHPEGGYKDPYAPEE